MGYYAPTVSRSSTQQYVDRLSRPTFTPGTGAGGFREPTERSPWESIRVPAEALNIAFRQPAEALESPIALGGWAIDQLLGGGKASPREASPGIIEGFGELVRGIPGIGAVAEGVTQAAGSVLSPLGDFAGNALYQLDSGTRSAMNLRWWRSVDQLKGMDPNAPLPDNMGGRVSKDELKHDLYGQYRDYPFSESETVGQYLAWLNNEIGLTYELQQGIWNGEVGPMDLGTGTGVRTAEGDVAEFLGPMAVNPLNFVGPGVAGAIISKAPVAVRVAAAAFLGSSKVTKVAPVAVNMAPKVIVTGKTFNGVTLNGFAAFGAQAAATAGRGARMYRNVALGTYAARVGVNTLDQLTPQEWKTNIPVLDNFYGIFRDIGQRKPLSNNELFLLGSMFAMPSLSAVRRGATNARDFARTGTVAGRNIPIVGSPNLTVEKALVRKVASSIPELKGKSYAVQHKYIIDTWGQDVWDDYVYQSMRAGSQRRNFLDGLSDDPYQKRNYFGTIGEMATQVSRANEEMRLRLAYELKTRRLTPQHVVDAAEDFYSTGGGSITRATGGVERQVWDGRKALDDFTEWRNSLAKPVSEAGGLESIVPKINTEVATKEGVQWQIAQIEYYAKQGELTYGIVTDILMAERAILTVDQELGAKLSKYIGRDARKVDSKVLLKEIREVYKEGVEMGRIVDESRLFAEEYQWANREAAIRDKTLDANRIGEDGRLREYVTPGPGQAEIQLASVRKPATIGTMADDPAATLRQWRADDGIALRELESPVAIDRAGYALDSVVQTSHVDGSIVVPSVSYRFDGKVSPQAAEEVAAVLLKNNPEIRSTTVVVRGSDTIQRHGLQANAIEFEWVMPERMTSTQFNEIARSLKNRFPGCRPEINGNRISLIIRDTDTRFAGKLEQRLKAINKQAGTGYRSSTVHVVDVVKKRTKNDPPGTRTIAEIARDADRTIGSGRRYRVADTELQRLSGRASHDLRGTARHPAQPGSGQPGYGGQPGSGTALADGGSGAIRNEASRLTPFERASTGVRRGRTTEYVVGPERIGEVQGRAGKAIGSGSRFHFPTGSTVFATADGGAGAWVTPDGELRVWRSANPDRATSTQHGHLLAEASEHATWARVASKRPAGSAALDELGQHGFRAVARIKGKAEVVVLVRDVDGITRALEIPPSGFKQIAGDIPVMSEEAAMTQIFAIRRQHFPNGADVRIPEVESQALHIVQTTQDIETAYIAHRGDPAWERALQISRERRGITDGMVTTENVAARTQGGPAESIPGFHRDETGAWVPDEATSVPPDALQTTPRRVEGEVIEGTSEREIRAREDRELAGAQAFDRTQQRARDETFMAELNAGDPRAQLSEDARVLLDAEWDNNGASLDGEWTADTENTIRTLEGRVGEARVREAMDELDVWHQQNPGWTADGPPAAPQSSPRPVPTSDQVPLGSTPVPPGKIRVYHYTRNPEAVRTEGLKRSAAVGETYGEPNVIWVSTQKPSTSQHAGVVEFFVDPSELDIGAPPRGTYTQAEIDELHRAGSNLTLKIDEVPPERFVTFADETSEGYAYLVKEMGMNPTPEQLKIVEGALEHGASDPRVAGYRRWYDEVTAPKPEPALSAIGKKYARIAAIDEEMRQIVGSLKYPNRSKKMRALQAERNEIAAGVRDAEFGIDVPPKVDTTPAPTEARAVLEQAMPEEQIRYIRLSEQEMADFVPTLDLSIVDNVAGLSPLELQKIIRLQTMAREAGGKYGLSVIPKGGTPFSAGQGAAYRQMVQGKQAVQTLVDRGLLHKTSQFLDFWKNPVYSRALSNEAMQEMYNQLMPYGATPGQIRRFAREIRKFYDERQVTIPFTGRSTGVRRYRRPDAIPIPDMQRIALAVFRPETINAIKAGGDDIVDITQRASSRFYRNLSKRYPAVDGKGSLGGLVDLFYGKGGQQTGKGTALRVGRRAIGGTKAFYHMLRFLADPRWYMLNWYEAEMLGVTRGGINAVHNARKTYIDESGRRRFVNESPQVEALAARDDFAGADLLDVSDYNPSVQADMLATGHLDPRGLGGFRHQMFDIENPQMVREYLAKELKHNPAVSGLLEQFGGDFDAFADEIVDQLGRFDEVGIKQTYLDEAAKIAVDANDRAIYDEIIQGLIPQQQALFKDITHLFHGNQNRANLERLANNPLLWWPVSYQLKAIKWLADLGFDRIGGRKTGWLGFATLAAATMLHENFMENEPDYATFWEDYPHTMQTLGMMLPMTPWDMGVYMSRPTRYASNWLASSLGVAEEDPFYPKDPANFLIRSFQVGPFFTSRLVNDIAQELDLDIQLPE